MARTPYPLADLSWRTKLELFAGLLILLCSLSIFRVGKTSQSTLTYDGGKITYTGQVKNHRMNGYGKLTYENGDVYEGNFVNGVFNGKGKFTSATGWTYEGEFKKGQADGKGILIAKDKQVFEGVFKQGVYQQ